MTLEGLLPFILLFIMWGASRILLKMAKARQKEGAPVARKPGFLKMLQEHFDNLEGRGTATENNDLEEYFQATPQPGGDEYEEELLADIEEPSLQQEQVITEREPVFYSPPGATTTLRKKPVAMMNRRKLQNAVIWAEILAPPVALRDQ